MTERRGGQQNTSLRPHCKPEAPTDSSTCSRVMPSLEVRRRRAQLADVETAARHDQSMESRDIKTAFDVRVDGIEQGGFLPVFLVALLFSAVHYGVFHSHTIIILTAFLTSAFSFVLWVQAGARLDVLCACRVLRHQLTSVNM